MGDIDIVQTNHAAVGRRVGVPAANSVLPFLQHRGQPLRLVGTPATDVQSLGVGTVSIGDLGAKWGSFHRAVQRPVQAYGDPAINASVRFATDSAAARCSKCRDFLQRDAQKRHPQ